MIAVPTSPDQQNYTMCKWDNIENHCDYDPEECTWN